MAEAKPPPESLARAQQIDALCDEFESSCRAGETPKIEEFLARLDAAEQSVLLQELLPLEIHYRKKRGEKPTAVEYRERFPTLGENIVVQSMRQPTIRSRSRPTDISGLSSQRIGLAETLNYVAEDKSPGDLPLPEMFGRYRILKALGKGAMGVVYLAHDTQLDRSVALKVPQLKGSDQKELIERFYREARSAATLRHPHICAVYDVGQLGDQHYITMAYIEGHPLAKYISVVKPQQPKAAAILIRKIAAALDEAHRHGIVHRDLKPGNIMIDSRGEPTVMDFGLARDFNRQDASQVTQTGMLVGTPSYMSPEQIEGDSSQIGPASDIWSLGVVFYQLLTGQLPFQGATIWKVVTAIQTTEPKPLAELRPDLPTALVAICHKMLTKTQEERYRSMNEVAVDLSKFLKEANSPQPLEAQANATPIMPLIPVSAAALPAKPDPDLDEGQKGNLVVVLAALSSVAVLAMLTLMVASSIIYRPEAKRESAESPASTPLIPTVNIVPAPTTIAPPPTPTPPKVALPNPEYDLVFVPLAKAPFNAAQAKAHQEAWAKYLGTQVETTNSVGAKMTLIPPGEFLMGSSDEDVALALRIAEETKLQPAGVQRIQEERPQHRVRITKPFRLGIYEVTIGQFGKFIEQSGYKTQAEEFGGNSDVTKADDPRVTPAIKKINWRTPGQEVGENSPVTQVSWNDAVAFCNWLSEQEKLTPSYVRDVASWELVAQPKGYRLPTEAEWEYACRAGSTMQYSFGDDWKAHDKFGWSNGNAGGRPRGVGLLPANPFGLYDMQGNVWEWCHDWYDGQWYARSPSDDPRGPLGTSHRVHRGGSWYFTPADCRSSSRGYLCTPAYRGYDRGFRMALSGDAVFPAAKSQDVPAVRRQLASSAPQPMAGDFLRNPNPLIGHLGAVRSVAITAEGKFGFSSGGWPNGDGIVRKWDLATGKELFAIKKHAGLVDAVACDAAGKRLLTGGKDHTVRFVDGETGEEVQVFSDHLRGINSVAVSPNGRWGASTSDDYTVRLWNLEESKPHGILSKHESPTTRVMISPDSRLVAAGAFSSEIVIGDLESATVVRRIRCAMATSDLCFSADGSRLVSSHYNGLVLLWEVATGKLLERLRVPERIQSVHYLADDKHLIAAGASRVYCLDLENGCELSSQALSAVCQLRGAGDRILMGHEAQAPLSKLQTWQIELPKTESSVSSYAVPRLAAQPTPREVVEWVLRVGGQFQVSGAAKPLSSVDQLPMGVWKCELVSLENCPLYSGEIAGLAALEDIRKLSLTKTGVTDDDLLPLSPLLEKIMDLKLGHSQVTNHTLDLLATNRGLGQLDVEYTAVTDVAFARVTAQNSLKLIACDSRQLTNRIRLRSPPMFLVLCVLPNATPQLGQLSLTMPASLTLLGDFREPSPVVCPDLSPLRGPSGLRSIKLQYLIVQAKDIQHLAAIRQLQKIEFVRCQMPEGSLEPLRRALSNCAVTVDGQPSGSGTSTTLPNTSPPKAVVSDDIRKKFPLEFALAERFDIRLRTAKATYVEGQTIPYSLEIVNDSKDTLRVTSLPRDSLHTQRWLERLEVDTEIPSISDRVARRGNKYGCGGLSVSLNANGIAPQGIAEKRNETISHTKLSPGKYRYSIELKLFEEPIKTAHFEFEIHAAGNK